MNTLISPIQPTRLFQIDPNLKRKCDTFREKFRKPLATAKYENGAEAMISPFDIRIPFKPGMTVDDIQHGMVSMSRDMEEIGQFVAFWDGPRQVFSFDNDLAALLAHTDVSDVPWEALRLPYEEFYIHFGCILAEALTFAGREYKADGAYVRLQKGASQLSGFVNGAIHVSVTTKLTSPDYEEVARQFPPGYSLKEPIYYITLSGYEGENAGSALERGQRTQLELATRQDEANFRATLEFAADCGISSEGAVNRQAAEQRFMRGQKLTAEALPLLLNCIFYLTTIASPVEPAFPPEAPKGLVEKLEHANSANRKRILSEDLARRGFTKVRFICDLAITDKTEHSPTGKTIRTHWRRGHWRRQPVGSGLTQIVLKWIRPCVVNAEREDALIGRVYDVRGGSENNLT